MQSLKQWAQEKAWEGCAKTKASTEVHGTIRLLAGLMEILCNCGACCDFTHLQFLMYL